MKIILFYLLLLAIIAIPVFSIQFMKHQAATKAQQVLPSPTLHDSSGKAITEAEKEIAKQETSFSNVKYGYTLKFSGNADVIANDNGLSTTDYFLQNCLSVTVFPSLKISAIKDKRFSLLISELRKMDKSSEGTTLNIPTGTRYGDLVVVDTFTKKPDTWLGLQEASVYEWSNNWEMLGNVRYFYTQHGKYNYVVIARYNGQCQNAKTLESISGFDFLSQD